MTGRLSFLVLAIVTGLSLVVVLIFSACSKKAPTTPDSNLGEFALLTYNVAGLPQGVSSSNPEQNIPLISPLLNTYDIVLVQEDFFYHEELISKVRHPYHSTPSASKNDFTSGDGLNRFSEFQFGNLERQGWQTCSSASGADCLANKGFSVAETEVAPGVKVDIYNVHFDAGGEQDDVQARDAQVRQLLDRMAQRSASKAVIVAGDFNLNLERRTDDVPLYDTLLQTAGLSDACAVTSCNTQLVDRVLYRGSDVMTLTAKEWFVAPEFVDGNGQKLSDHFAVGVRIAWQTSGD